MRTGKSYVPGMYASDTERVKDMCLNCTKPDCRGDCAARREAAGLRVPKERQYTARENLNPAYLSPREREFVALYDKGLCDRECAEQMGIRASSAWYIRTKLGLPSIGRKGRLEKRQSEVGAFA